MNSHSVLLWMRHRTVMNALSALLGMFNALCIAGKTHLSCYECTLCTVISSLCNVKNTFVMLWMHSLYCYRVTLSTVTESNTSNICLSPLGCFFILFCVHRSRNGVNTATCKPEYAKSRGLSDCGVITGKGLKKFLHGIEFMGIQGSSSFLISIRCPFNQECIPRRIKTVLRVLG